MFPVFVTMLAFAVLVFVGRMFVLFVLTTMLVFFPLVFTAAAVMFGPLCCFLSVSFDLLLQSKHTHKRKIRCKII